MLGSLITNVPPNSHGNSLRCLNVVHSDFGLVHPWPSHFFPNVTSEQHKKTLFALYIIILANIIIIAMKAPRAHKHWPVTEQIHHVLPHDGAVGRISSSTPDWLWV